MNNPLMYADPSGYSALFEKSSIESNDTTGLYVVKRKAGKIIIGQFGRNYTAAQIYQLRALLLAPLAAPFADIFWALTKEILLPHFPLGPDKDSGEPTIKPQPADNPYNDPDLVPGIDPAEEPLPDDNPDDDDDEIKFYYRAVGFDWRDTEEIQADLRPYLHIPGVDMIRDDLNDAQEAYEGDNGSWNYWKLSGRKMEAERAIYYASRNMLVSTQSRSAPDFTVRNFGIITKVEVKWTSVDYLHSEQRKKINRAIINTGLGVLLVEYNVIGPGLEKALKKMGGRAY